MINNRTWVEVNLDNIVENYNNLKNHSKCNRVMAVIKADAYGNGAVEVAKVLEKDGCDYFAVAALDEALQLRKEGIKTKILVLGYVDIECFDLVVDNDLTITVYDVEYAKKLNEVCKAKNKKVTIHIKIDTGMTRYGFNYKIASSEIEKIKSLSNIHIEGMYTHFASADEECSKYTYMQFENYMFVVKELDKLGINIPMKHVANSATTIMYKEMHLDIVRCGIALYGCYPSSEVDKNVELKPTMSLKSKIARLEKVEKGVSISYGCTFTTHRESLIATLPIGYADGFMRSLSGKALVCINGEYAKVVGRICMDSCMIDVTDIKGNLNVEDEVEIFGDNIKVERVAEQIGTINYEVLCAPSKRVPRVYTKSEGKCFIKKYLT